MAVRDKIGFWGMAFSGATMWLTHIAAKFETPFIQGRLSWVYLLAAIAVLVYWMPLKLAVLGGAVVCASSVGLYYLGTPAPTSADGHFVVSTLALVMTVTSLIAIRLPTEDETPT